MGYELIPRDYYMNWAQALDYICSHVCNKYFLLPVYICDASLNTVSLSGSKSAGNRRYRWLL